MIRYRKLNEYLDILRPEVKFSAPQGPENHQRAKIKFVGWTIVFDSSFEEASDTHFLVVFASIADIVVRHEYKVKNSAEAEGLAVGITEYLYGLVVEEGGFTKQTLNQVLVDYEDLA